MQTQRVWFTLQYIPDRTYIRQPCIIYSQKNNLGKNNCIARIPSPTKLLYLIDFVRGIKFLENPAGADLAEEMNMVKAVALLNSLVQIRPFFSASNQQSGNGWRQAVFFASKTLLQSLTTTTVHII